jgi:hypothetical protein
VTPLATPVVVRLCPFALGEGVKGEQMYGLAQMHVAREAEPDECQLAASVGDRRGAGVPLQMPERLPATDCIAEFRVQARDGGPRLCVRERHRPMAIDAVKPLLLVDVGSLAHEHAAILEGAIPRGTIPIRRRGQLRFMPPFIIRRL